MPRLTAISGVGVKGPACFLLEIGGQRLLLDLGKGPDAERLPDLDGISRVDAILFSHGHADHTGGLELWEALGRPPLYATAPTIALSPHAPLHAAKRLEETSDILGIAVETGPCGHAPGAVWMRLGGEDGLVYTGDVSFESGLFLSSLPPVAASLVFDASYGVSHMPLAEQIAVIEAAMGDAVLFPCPAGGRGLEMALHFLNRGLAVSLCPSHRQVAARLAEHPDWLMEGGREALACLLERCGTLDEGAPIEGVMIAAGPNAERGVAAPLAARMIGEKHGQVIFTGHIASGMPAEKMVASGEARFLRWNVHPPLSGQKALVEAVSPRQALAAFCSPGELAELRERTGWPIADGNRIEW